MVAEAEGRISIGLRSMQEGDEAYICCVAESGSVILSEAIVCFVVKADRGS